MESQLFLSEQNKNLNWIYVPSEMQLFRIIKHQGLLLWESLKVEVKSVSSYWCLGQLSTCLWFTHLHWDTVGLLDIWYLTVYLLCLYPSSKYKFFWLRALKCLFYLAEKKHLMQDSTFQCLVHIFYFLLFLFKRRI